MGQALPEVVEDHLKRLYEKSTGEWVSQEGALDRLRDTWAEKDRLFGEQARLLGLEEVETVDSGDERGMLLLTYSGSLVSLGPGSSRWMEYASVKLRTDVPDIIRVDSTRLDAEIGPGKSARFTDGPVKHTSALYRLVACPADLAAREQDTRIREATVFLTNSFVHLNRSLMTGEVPDVEGFTKKDIVAYLARRHDMAQKTIQEILDDYLTTLQAGLLTGRTVPLGKLGRLSLKVTPRRKARLVRNPRSGEEITVPARDACYRPAFKFSAGVKERAESLPLAEGDREEDED